MTEPLKPVTFTFRTDEALAARLREYAKANPGSIGSHVRFAVKQYLERRGHMESNRVMVSGDRYQVSGQAWDNWVGNTTPAEFMDGYNAVDAAVSEYVNAIPDMWGEGPPPVFYWREMNAEYTLTELLTRYLEDHENEWAD
jgi:hypothetical protein